jgi:NAD(P)-dependent dehydrogenase (short-subunit alcohol dehydrogenase family)
VRHFILVTGASSGIGQSACEVLLRHGYSILAGVRTQEDAERLRVSFGGNIYPVLMDVTDPEGMAGAVRKAEMIIGEDALVAIINNAGVAVSGAVLYIPIEEWRQQLEINVIGVIRTTQLFFPLLSKPKGEGDTHPRRIINVGSVSGLFGSPFLGPYVASKYALEGLSDSLRRELYMYDIQVVILEPGNIQTPIWEKAKQKPTYFGQEYASIMEFKDRIIDNNIKMASPLKLVDDVILKAVRNKKVNVRYLIRAEKWKFSLIRNLPVKWVDALIRKKLQKKSGFRPF